MQEKGFWTLRLLDSSTKTASMPQVWKAMISSPVLAPTPRNNRGYQHWVSNSAYQQFNNVPYEKSHVGGEEEEGLFTRKLLQNFLSSACPKGIRNEIFRSRR